MLIAAEFADALANMLTTDEDNTLGLLNADDCTDVFVESAVSFGSAGVLTSDDGIVVRLTDGTEFHVKIIRSR